MSEWSVEFSSYAEKDLIAIDQSVRRRILDSIVRFSENFETLTPLPLHGEWKGFFKLRVGDWRVVYNINYLEKIITVHYIDRRDKVYKIRG